MMKNNNLLNRNKKTLVLISILILLPSVFGILMWNSLPDSLPVHWDFSGNPDGYAGRPFAVIGLPLILLLLLWVCVLGISKDPKAHNVNSRVFRILLWIFPVISLIFSAFIYSYSMGIKVNVTMITLILLGLMFIVIGNYLPKCKPTYTIGIRVPWTLADPENWTKTHRLGGKLFIAAGFISIVSIFLGTDIPAIISLIAAGVIPVIYSFVIYKK